MDRYRISELADRVGVPPTTLRYYESQGLLPAQRTGSGYRTYDDRDVERMRFITVAKKLGLSLDRIRDLLGVWQDGVCRDVRNRLRPLVAEHVEHVEHVDQQITDLRHFRDSLTAALTRLDALPSRATPCDPTCLFLADVGTPQPWGDPSVTPGVDDPIACTLTGDDYRKRIDHWREVLSDTTSEWTAEGAIRTTVPVDRLPALTGLIAAESHCCPFFTFHLTIAAGLVQLDIRAPAEARSLLEELFQGDPAGRCAC